MAAPAFPGRPASCGSAHREARSRKIGRPPPAKGLTCADIVNVSASRDAIIDAADSRRLDGAARKPRYSWHDLTEGQRRVLRRV